MCIRDSATGAELRVGRCEVYRHGRRIGLRRAAVDGHGYGGVVVFEAHQLVSPELSRAHVSAFDSWREAHVDSGDIFGEDGGARAEFDR